LLLWLGHKSESKGLNKILLVVHTPSYKKPKGLRKQSDPHFLSLHCLETAVTSGQKKSRKTPTSECQNKIKIFSLKIGADIGKKERSQSEPSCSVFSPLPWAGLYQGLATPGRGASGDGHC